MQDSSSRRTPDSICAFLNLFIGVIWASAGALAAALALALGNQPSNAIPHLILLAAAMPAFVAGVVLLPGTPFERPRLFAILTLSVAVVGGMGFWVTFAGTVDHPLGWDLGTIALVHFPAYLVLIALVEVIYLLAKSRTRAA